jgi:dTDP-4-amino-4,6-dideoxygalactose transaminase
MTPYNRPFIGGKELSNIAQAVIKYQHISGDGVFTKRCQKWLQETLGCPRALLTHSCTAALEMAAILCDIQPGDEVIMPSYTFVSTANAFVLRGGVPVFVDIRPDTLNMDETRIEEAITPRTKAIVPVHYAGVPCAMDEINAIAKESNLFVIEDAAQALLSKYKNRFLGTLGHMGTLSFHETKNIISGEGGALLLNDERLAERAEIIWEKGTNRKKFFRGEVDKYTWVDLGSSFLPSEIIAAFLHAQLEMTETIINARCRLFDLYYSLLEPLHRREKIGLPWMENLPEHTCPSNGHIFYIVTASLEERTALIEHLKENDIHAVFHYIPLHSSPAGKRFGRTCGDLDVTTDLSDRVLRLPLFYEMEEKEVHEVVDRINEFYR